MTMLTKILIETNEVQVFGGDVPGGSCAEAWAIKNGRPHCLLLSCQPEHKAEMVAIIREIKEAAKAGGAA